MEKIKTLLAIVFGKRFTYVDVDEIYGGSCRITGYRWRGVIYITKIEEIR